MSLRVTRPVMATVFAATVAVVGGGLLVREGAAQGPSIDLSSPQALRLALDPQVGKRVRLKLVSGQDVEGQVVQVGAHAVALTTLTGMEFYDATVKLDQVAAVIVRVRNK